MKKLLLICLLVFTAQFHAQDNTDTAFLNDTIEFLKSTGTSGAFDMAISQIGVMVPEANKAAFTEEAQSTQKDLFAKIAQIYMEEFTHDDIKALIAFYRSDIGKKMAEKQVPLMQKTMALGQTWGMELSEIALKYKQ